MGAPGALDLTDAMPLSRAWVVLYISLRPIDCPLVAVSEK
ncbi:Uncharacterised protein [Bordetella pertussis]|nr:Uncharacterised protein [Bordetella pertussis]